MCIDVVLFVDEVFVVVGEYFLFDLYGVVFVLLCDVVVLESVLCDVVGVLGVIILYVYLY